MQCPSYSGQFLQLFDLEGPLTRYVVVAAVTGQHKEQLCTNLQVALSWRRSSQCTGGQDCDSEGAAQAAVMVWQEPHKGQTLHPGGG